ncbi:hypothetical protein ABTZ78_17290 [Streptomyces bauhiniae]|uniref:hypothetical protein n=1 Tax=Streptomyces bauhiniae TaxID=2340725 RepID=UPI00331C53A5
MTTMTDWIDEGNAVGSLPDLKRLTTALNAEIHHMRTALARAAWGALNGAPWTDDPGDDRARPKVEDVLDRLRMSVVPPGMTAKEATYRQALAALLGALETADEAALTVWLAGVNAEDPHRPA